MERRGWSGREERGEEGREGVCPLPREEKKEKSVRMITVIA